MLCLALPRFWRALACAVLAGASTACAVHRAPADGPIPTPPELAEANPPSSGPDADTLPDPAASDLVISALAFLGVRYQLGGSSVETGFDCSGFTRHIYAESLGLQLPRTADEQARAPALQDVRRDSLQPGDLVFFNTLRRTYSHVGIYLGDGKFIHAPRVGARVRVEDMGSAYWSRRYTGARRADAARLALGESRDLP